MGPSNGSTGASQVFEGGNNYVSFEGAIPAGGVVIKDLDRRHPSDVPDTVTANPGAPISYLAYFVNKGAANMTVQFRMTDRVPAGFADADMIRVEPGYDKALYNLMIPANQIRIVGVAADTFRYLVVTEPMKQR